MVGLADQFGHFIELHLIHQIVPGVGLAVLQSDGAVQRYADEVGQGQFPFLAQGRHGALLFGVDDGVQSLHQLVVGGHLHGGLVGVVGKVGLGHGARPVGAGQVLDVVAGIGVELVQVAVIQLVGDGKAGAGGGVGGGVLLGLLVNHGQVSPSFAHNLGGIHSAVQGIVLGGLLHEDVVQGFVGAVAGGEVIAALVHDVGFRAVGVIGTHFGLRHGHVGGHGLARGHVDLGVAHQLHGGLFDAVLLVVSSVGALHVDQHRFPGVPVRGVGHVHGEVEHVAVLLHVQLAVGKIAVIQAIAEGEGHGLGVVVIAYVLVAQHHVLIAGFVVAVADVDAFLIDHIVFVVGLGEGQALFRRVGVGGHIGVLHSGRGGVVVAVGIHQTAGGIDFAAEQIADGADAALAHFAHPQAGVDAKVLAAHSGLDHIQLHRVGGVQQQHDLLQGTGGFQLSQLAQDVLFLGADGEHVAVRVAGAHHGQVLAFAANTADDHDGGVAVLGNGIPFRGGEGAQGRFVDSEFFVLEDVVIQGTGGALLAVILARAFPIEAPQGGVHGEAVLLQGVL